MPFKTQVYGNKKKEEENLIVMPLMHSKNESVHSKILKSFVFKISLVIMLHDIHILYVIYL